MEKSYCWTWSTTLTSDVFKNTWTSSFVDVTLAVVCAIFAVVGATFAVMDATFIVTGATSAVMDAIFAAMGVAFVLVDVTDISVIGI